MRYIPSTDRDRTEMLQEIGADSVESLFSSIPEIVRWKDFVGLPPAMTEAELQHFFREEAFKNSPARDSNWRSYLGAGCYEHFIPTVVDSLSGRSEFVTAYTPYQPEVSQGTLQAIFEFQSMVANLFGMEIANASMYDGASSLAEAALLAVRTQRKKKRILLSEGIHPDYRSVVRAYTSDVQVELEELPLDEHGQTILPESLEDVAAVMVQQPNFYGVVEPLTELAQATHEAKGLFVVNTTEALAFGILKSPGEQGADIVVGEGQSLGNPQNFGGPHVGLFAAQEKYLRQLPGRLVGEAKDSNGNSGYVLTLSTREQHIRREKATSNICTNHSLCALRSCIYMATLGSAGLRSVAIENAKAAQYLKTKLKEISAIDLLFDGPTFNEFTVRLPISSEAFLAALEKEKILGGVALSRWAKERDRELVLAVTETKNQADLDRYVDVVRKVL